MTTSPERLDSFLGLSAVLTGFTHFRLQATGQAESYLATLQSVVGASAVDDLHGRYLGIDQSADLDARSRALRTEILSDPRLGPIARNVIKMWFVGTWYQLPQAWRDRFGTSELDVTFVVSPMAYTEGLLWPTIGANPPGAKAPGYATWVDPPRIPEA